MADYQFAVTVSVDGWDAQDGRTEADYAAEALRCADVPVARRLDGYADLGAEADIIDVELIAEGARP
jgi:hypothetical protein